MKNSSIFRSLCLVMVWVYLTAAAQAGQVVTSDTKTWAKQTLNYAKTEKKLAPISATNTIAVLYFNNKTGQEELNALQKGMAIMLITDLAKISTIQVVERIKLQALLDEMELGGSGLVDQTTAPKVGKILGAYYLSNGDIVSGKTTQLKIDPVIIDVPFGTTAPQTASSGNLQDVFRMEKEILFGIVEQMKIYLSPREKEELDIPFAASSAAALAFFAGVNLSDAGKYTQAVGMYEKAVALDQNFTVAKDALQELKTLGLTKGTETTKNPPTSNPATDEGISTSTIVWTTLGVAVLAGGAALALSSGGGSSNNNSGNLKATSPLDGGNLTTCTRGGTLQFSSSKVLVTNSCTATIGTAGWTIGKVTTSATSVSVPYSPASTSSCTTGNKMAVTVSNCQDTQGNMLSSQSFTYVVP